MGNIASLLGGGGPMGGSPMGGAGGAGGGGAPGQPDSPQAEQDLQTAIRALHSFMQTEQDDQDKTVAAKCLASLQGIVGGRAAQDDAALGTTPAHKAVRRATQSAQQGQGY